MKDPVPKESIAERTRAYIDAHPSIKDCISKDLINYSSLARQIMKDLDIKNEEAVMIACRRYAQKLSKRDHEKEILRILGSSRIEVKTKICSVTAKNDWTVLHKLELVFIKLINEKAIMQIIQGAQAITIIADEKLKNEIVNAIGKENVLHVRPDLVEIYGQVAGEDHRHLWRFLLSCRQPRRERRQPRRDGVVLHRHHLHSGRERHDTCLFHTLECHRERGAHLRF